MIPQTIYVTLLLVSLLISANRHGKPRTAENFPIYFISALLTLGLVYWGGFFDCWFK